MSDRPNVPVPDELAAVREQIKALETREGQLRQLLLTNPDLREGAAWLAEIKTTKRSTTDLKELRACHPDLVAEFTFDLDVTRIVLSGVSEDGEIVPSQTVPQGNELLMDRFWSRVAISKPSDCWEWNGARDSNGYGRLRWDGKNMLAHRVARMLITVGGVLDDRDILHGCDNPPCCNPLHLWPGTAKDNVADMFAKGRQKAYDRKTHCAHGHEFTEENTLWVRSDKYLSRQCRACNRQRALKHHYNNRDVILPKMRARAAARRRSK